MGGSTPTSPPPLLSAAPETPELWTNQGCPALFSKTGQILAGTRGPHLCAYVFQRVWLNNQCPEMLAWETKLVALARPRAGAASLASLGPQSHMGPLCFIFSQCGFFNALANMVAVVVLFSQHVG